jgi:hypothetical protein
MAGQFSRASKSKAGGTKMTRTRSFSCNAPLWNRRSSGANFSSNVKKQLVPCQNRSGRRKKSSNVTGAGILRGQRNSIEDGRQNRCAVTTNHLLFQHSPWAAGALLPISQPNLAFLGQREKQGGPGGGGQQRATAERAVSISSHGILCQMANMKKASAVSFPARKRQ